VFSAQGIVANLLLVETTSIANWFMPPFLDFEEKVRAGLY
jgi:hypothetical protein